MNINGNDNCPYLLRELKGKKFRRMSSSPQIAVVITTNTGLWGQIGI